MSYQIEYGQCCLCNHAGPREWFKGALQSHLELEGEIRERSTEPEGTQ